MIKQLSKEEAIEFSEKKLWEGLSHRQRAEFQLQQKLLCMPFSVFHEATEKALGRPVWTHEFGLNKEGLKQELFNGKAPPTFEEIVNLIPKDKRAVIVVG